MKLTSPGQTKNLFSLTLLIQICSFRTGDQHTCYLVEKGNMKVDIRKEVGKQILLP